MAFYVIANEAKQSIPQSWVASVNAGQLVAIAPRPRAFMAINGVVMDSHQRRVDNHRDFGRLDL